MQICTIITGSKVLIRWVLAFYMHHEQRLLQTNDAGQIMQILRYNKIESKVSFDGLLIFPLFSVANFVATPNFFRTSIQSKTLHTIVLIHSPDAT